MHMGYNDSRRFPDFSLLGETKERLTAAVTCVAVTHFHLDHSGALPYLTEICGYSGPVIMSAPTASICPALLEDFRKIAVDRRGETNFFTTEDIDRCMRKVKRVCTIISMYYMLDCTT